VPRAEQGKEHDPRPRGERIKKQYGEDAAELQIPDLGNAQFLVDWLFEVGPTTGEQRLEWVQLESWQRQTGVELDEFCAVALVKMSGAYLGMLHEAREPNCPAPFEFERTETEVKARQAALVQQMKERRKGRG
jgi:hypothetical protein